MRPTDKVEYMQTGVERTPMVFPGACCSYGQLVHILFRGRQDVDADVFIGCVPFGTYAIAQVSIWGVLKAETTLTK